ncbi:MAG TPA: MBL fold metallo-hydrolase [Candidatus Baltobacteraceae bacterium]|nr:MBL fold metallo-hydrolase [Candidatus Baltobacteraceae bacterium]
MAPAIRLRIVGSSPSVQRPGRVCSSYLLRTREASVLVDLGSGALGNLHLAIDYPQLDAVVITHMHADHFLDLIPLRYALKYGPLLRDLRLPLWLPPGGSKMLRTICNAFAPEGTSDFLDEVFEVREFDPSRQLDIGDLKLTFCKTRHYIDTYAVRAERDHSSVVYSSDTAPCDEVVELARNCSLFLCEATLGLGTENGCDRGHLSAEEAGDMAQRAGAHRLVLTHYSSTYAHDELMEAAVSRFKGRISIADDGVELSV